MNRRSGLNDLAGQAEFDPQKYSEASKLGSEMLQARYYHVVAISLVLFEAYRQMGPNMVEQIAQVVQACVGVNFDKLFPEKRRKEHLQVRLSWLFGEMDGFSRSYEKSNPEVLAKWREALAPGDIVRAIEALTVLRPRLSEDYPRLTSAIGGYLEWLRGQPRVSEKELDNVGEDDRAGEGAVEGVASGQPAAAADVAAGATDSMQIAISARLALLLAKLAAFEQLVELGRYDKAAVVSVDVRRELETFDPRLYFPDLFAKYSELMSEHVDEIAPHFENKESLTFQLLHEYYTVNLTGFVGD